MTSSHSFIGTQSVHHIELISWGFIKHSQYSSSLEAATHTFLHSSEDEPQAHPAEPLGNIKKICYKEKKSSREFIGLVTESWWAWNTVSKEKRLCLYPAHKRGQVVGGERTNYPASQSFRRQQRPLSFQRGSTVRVNDWKIFIKKKLHELKF